MARQLRVKFPGAIYHVTCRMVGDAPSPGGYGGTGAPPEQHKRLPVKLFAERSLRKKFQQADVELRRLRTEHCKTHEAKE